MTQAMHRHLVPLLLALTAPLVGCGTDKPAPSAEPAQRQVSVVAVGQQALAPVPKARGPYRKRSNSN